MGIPVPLNILSLGPTIGPSFSLVSLTFQRAPKEQQGGTGHERKLEELFIKTPLVQRDADIFSLLSWHNEISTFVGRDAELEALRSWAEDPDTPMSMRFVVGPGGIGKTRLAAEFGRAMRKKGWAAGFVNLGNKKSYRLEDTGTLLIIDYPEEQFGQVDQLFQDLAGLRELEALPKLRILFLTRINIEGWRQRALDSGVTDLVSRTEVAPGQLSAEDAAVLTNSAQGKACKQTVCADLPAPRPFEPADLDRWMALRPEHKRPLFLVAAGIYSALHPDVNVLGFSGPELVMALVDRELTRLRKSSASLGLEKSALPRLLALATIAGGAAWDRVREEWQALHPLLPAPPGWNGAEQLREAGWLRDLALNKTADTENGTNTVLGLEAMTPDIVGAALVVKVLSDARKAAPELAYIGSQLAADPEEFVNTLARLDYDARFVLGLEHSLPEWLRKAVEGNAERCSKLVTFAGQMLPRTMAPLGISLCQCLRTTATSVGQKAKLLDYLSAHLATAGDKKAAMEASQEALHIFKMLANANPELYLPDLAASLNNLTLRLDGFGENPVTLAHIKEATDIFEKLSGKNPAHRPGLAECLNNLSVAFANSDDRPAALATIKYAADTFKQLADEDPAYRPGLADSLHNFSIHLADSGQTDAALVTIQEAIDINYSLVNKNPALLSPNLADNLGTKGFMLTRNGDHRAAAASFKEGMEIMRPFAEAQPGTPHEELFLKLKRSYERASELLSEQTTGPTAYLDRTQDNEAQE